MITVEEIMEKLEAESRFDIFCREHKGYENAKELAREVIKKTLKEVK